MRKYPARYPDDAVRMLREAKNDSLGGPLLSIRRGLILCELGKIIEVGCLFAPTRVMDLKPLYTVCNAYLLDASQYCWRWTSPLLVQN